MYLTVVAFDIKKYIENRVIKVVCVMNVTIFRIYHIIYDIRVA